MTSAQAATLARAQERATLQGIRVVARCVIRATGARYFVVTSSVPGRLYYVGIAGKSLYCTCPAGQDGVVCKHRACVHTALVEERAASK